jgi:cysteine-rich repeat protein
MKCKGGGLKSPDICSEPCGDGLNAGFYACDDGNNFDGDGCSANCTLEENY